MPLSTAETRDGAAVSTVTVSAAEAGDVPVPLLTLAVRVWVPWLSVDAVMVHSPEPLAVAVPTADAPSYNTTVDDGSAVPVMAGVVTLVMVSEVEPLLEAAVSANPLGAAGPGRVMATMALFVKLAASVPSIA